MNLIAGFIAALFAVIKGIWGSDKPQETTVHDSGAVLPPVADGQVLDDLGVSARIADHDRVRDDFGTDYGSALSDRPSWSTDQSAGSDHRPR